MGGWRGERREADVDCVKQLKGAQLTFACRALCVDGHSVISLSIVGARPSFSSRSGGGRGHTAQKATAKDEGGGVYRRVRPGVEPAEAFIHFLLFFSSLDCSDGRYKLLHFNLC